MIGSELVIPCNVTASFPDDQVTLILWYKGDSGNPIYSVDSRQVDGVSLKKLSHKQLENRVTFSINYTQASLSVRPVKEIDAGEYKCRVDFKRSRTLSSIMKIIVIGGYS